MAFTSFELTRNSLVPRLPPPPLARNYCVIFCVNSHGTAGGEPGTFYHVSDVEGREKVLGRENLIARG